MCRTDAQSGHSINISVVNFDFESWDESSWMNYFGVNRSRASPITFCDERHPNRISTRNFPRLSLEDIAEEEESF